jgi:SSS family solute:Na+ symporter
VITVTRSSWIFTTFHLRLVHHGYFPRRTNDSTCAPLAAIVQNMCMTRFRSPLVSHLSLLLLLLFLPTTLAAEKVHDVEEGLLEWSELPPVPGGVGFAGPYVGRLGDRLVVIGGANFPTAPIWEASKSWYGDIHSLEPDQPDAEWVRASVSIEPRAYGITVSHPELGLFLIGGSDGERHHGDVRRLSSVSAISGASPTGPVTLEVPLPEPVAYGAGVLVGDTVYVIGGTPVAGSTTASSRIHALDLREAVAAQDSDRVADWVEIESIPDAHGRMLSVAGTHGGALYVFGGCSLAPGDDGSPVRTYLTDSWRYDPSAESGERWSELAPMPRSSVAAPGPAMNLGESFLAIVGGDDGRNATRIDELRDRHPGFPDDLLAYHVLTDEWSTRTGFPRDPGPDPEADPNAGSLPPVTTGVVDWNGAYIIPTGEVRPRVRTPRTWVATPRFTAPRFTSLDWAALGTYLLALILMGVYFARREHSTEDFFLAGRRIPWWAAGVSIFATQLSAITFMAIPAKSYASDWTYFIQSMGIFAMAPVVAYLFLPFFRRLDVTTAYEYLEHRFSLGIRLFGSAQYLLFQFGRMAVVVYLPALALSAVTGFDIYVCILLMGVLCIIYTVLGGVEAVIWSDVIQAFVLLGGAVLIVYACASGVEGGFTELFERAQGAGRLRLANLDAGWDFAQASLPVVILGGIFINLVPYASDQSVVQRYLTTRDERSARKAIWLGGILAIPASILFFGIGSALFGFYDANPERLVPLERTDQILPWFLVNEIPTGIAGLVIAGIFAAAMSSLDSSMNSSATALVTDFYRRFRSSHDEAHYLRLARILTVVLGVVGTGVAVTMASFSAKGIFDQWLEIVGLFAGGLCGLFVLGIFSRRASSGSAVVGIITSVATLVYVKNFTSIDGLTYAAFGVSTCVLAGWLAGFILPSRRTLGGLTLSTLHEPRSDDR